MEGILGLYEVATLPTTGIAAGMILIALGIGLAALFVESYL